MVTVITKLFNQSMNLGIFPHCFKYGLLIPIPKPGKQDYTDKNNSRGITLLTTLGKLYEKVLHEKLVQDCTSKNIPFTNELQDAGKKNISCLHSNFLMRETVHYVRKRNKSVYLAFLDIEKAFDKVWQNGLLFKLLKKNVNSKIAFVIADSFHDFKLCVSLGSQYSDWFNVKQGVHQGGPLSSVLFQLYFDELLNSLQESNKGVSLYGTKISCIAYADDLALIASSSENLQAMLDIAFMYSKRWRFRFSPSKSVVMFDGSCKSKPQLYLGETILQEVNVCTYLGTPIYLKESFVRDSIQERIKQAYRKVWMIKSLGSMRVQINPLTFSKAYWPTVGSKLVYGLFLMNLKSCTLDKIDKFHVNVAKNVQGLSNNTPAVVALSGLKWCRLSTYICKELLGFIEQIMKLPAVSIYKRIFVARVLELKRNNMLYENSIVSNMLQMCLRYELLNHVYEMIIDCKMCNEWKKVVKERLYQKEEYEMKATVIMYRSLNSFQKIECSIKNGFIWWEVAKKNVNILYKVKVIMRTLVTNNEKCGYRCNCEEVPDISHILFRCSKNVNTRELWYQKLSEDMPEALMVDFNNLDDEEKMALMYACYRGFVNEWQKLYVSTLNFLYQSIKSWYNALNV
jgi:hypothetical protein